MMNGKISDATPEVECLYHQLFVYSNLVIDDFSFLEQRIKGIQVVPDTIILRKQQDDNIFTIYADTYQIRTHMELVSSYEGKQRVMMTLKYKGDSENITNIFRVRDEIAQKYGFRKFASAEEVTESLEGIVM